MWNYDYRILDVKLGASDYFDGDTFSATLDNGRRSRFDTKIRLGDIDTWEIRKPRGLDDALLIEEHKKRGKAAKAAMALWMQNQRDLGNTLWVRSLDINEFDNFGRLLGAVYARRPDGSNISLGDYLREHGHEKYELTHADLYEDTNE
jgi:endonuclease YncB( thermonuclease family)